MSGLRRTSSAKPRTAFSGALRMARCRSRLDDGVQPLSSRTSARRLACVVAGGRVFDHNDVNEVARRSASSITCARSRWANAATVCCGQLRAGFHVRGVRDGYLDDWHSAGYATHLVWENPDRPGETTSVPPAARRASRLKHGPFTPPRHGCHGSPPVVVRSAAYFPRGSAPAHA